MARRPLGVERPDVEVLDAIPSVQGSAGGALAQRLADKPADVASRTLQVTREQPRLDLLTPAGSARTTRGMTEWSAELCFAHAEQPELVRCTLGIDPSPAPSPADG
jgi:hypothetical protein